MFIKRWRFFQNISSKKLDRAALAELEEERRLKEKREKEERRRKELTEELCSQTREGRVVIACRDRTRFFNIMFRICMREITGVFWNSFFDKRSRGVEVPVETLCRGMLNPTEYNRCCALEENCL